MPETRRRILAAAVDLIAASDDSDIAVRQVCDAAGIRLPTLYHYFGNKDGLLDAVAERCVDRLTGAQSEPDDHPVTALRSSWDRYVAWGVANPRLFELVHRRVRPDTMPETSARMTAQAVTVLTAAADRGLLIVDPMFALQHLISSVSGLTLHLVIGGQTDPVLSAAIRDATIAAIVGMDLNESADDDRILAESASRLLYALPTTTDLGPAETTLLRAWLTRLSDEPGD